LKLGQRLIGKVTITKKLISAFLLIAMLLAFTGGLASYYLIKIETTNTDLIDIRAVILSNALKMQVEVVRESNALRGYMVTRDSSYIDNLYTAEGEISSLIYETTAIAALPELLSQLGELEAQNKVFVQKAMTLIKMVENNDSEAQINAYYVNDVLPTGKLLDPIADAVAENQLQFMHEGSQNSHAVVKTALRDVALLSIIAFILAIVIGYIFARMISKPIITVAHATERIAAGDLKIEPLQIKNKDEIGSMAIAFNAMAQNLRELVQQIASSAEHVASSSEELTATAEQASHASENMVQSIQYVTGNANMQTMSVNGSVIAINEMSSGVQQIASSAQTTSNLSIETAQKAISGNQAIQQTVQQMDSIHLTMNHLVRSVADMEHHLNEIGQVVDVITEIAEQTNLLALNAAIEASRAGEQGRGFAVVAAEVRKLAEQSSHSVAKIASLASVIQAGTSQVVHSTELGVNEVNKGIQIAHTAGQLFEEIKQNIDDVSKQVLEISAASQQISASTDQVVSSIENISEGAQWVANESKSLSVSTEDQLASMEEVATSASSLATMAEELNIVVNKFKI